MKNILDLRPLTMRGRLSGYAPLLGVVLASTGCGGSTEPTVVNPATLTAVSETLVTAMVRTIVTPSPTVQVRDRDGKPVAGVRVTFAALDGRSEVDGGFGTTDGNGRATAVWTLGARSGPALLSASSPGLNTVTFRAMVTSGAATTLIPVFPTRLTGLAGVALRERPEVRVVDVFGNPVEGVVVSFAVTSGGGTVARSTAVTDFNGLANAGQWTLGGVGTNSVEASTAGLQSTVLSVTAVSVSGSSYLLERVNTGSTTSRPPGSIVLGTNGEFVIDVDGIIGHGHYQVSQSTIEFRYSDDFLARLRDFTAYQPGIWRVEDGRETGTITVDNIVIYRCLTEDCYDSYWTYQKAAP